MEMETYVLITFIIAASIIIIIALYQNRGKLKRLGIKMSKNGVEFKAEMNKNSNSNESNTGKSKTTIEGIHQEGNRDKIQIDSKETKAKDIKQTGDDNTIKIG